MQNGVMDILCLASFIKSFEYFIGKLVLCVIFCAIAPLPKESYEIFAQIFDDRFGYSFDFWL